MVKYILCSKGDTSFIPYEFWQWDILTEYQLKRNEENWHIYQGNPSLIPFKVMKQIESFERHIGRAIIRPCMFGDYKVMLGT